MEQPGPDFLIPRTKRTTCEDTTNQLHVYIMMPNRSAPLAYHHPRLFEEYESQEQEVHRTYNLR